MPLTLTSPSVPLNDADVGTLMFPVTSLFPVPVNVGWLTVPAGVPLTLTFPSVPEKLALVGTLMFPVTKRTAVPEKVGCVKLSTTPVATVVLLPFVGNVPALNEPSVITSFLLLTVNVGIVQLGKVPTFVILFTVVVLSDTAPPEHVPAGVYVVVPLDAALTVAVLLPLVRDTLPAGVNVPVLVMELPVKVGWLTVPAGVYVAVPELAALTVVVLFSLDNVTEPDGVNLPVLVVAVPVKVG